MALDPSWRKILVHFLTRYHTPRSLHGSRTRAMSRTELRVINLHICRRTPPWPRRSRSLPRRECRRRRPRSRRRPCRTLRMSRRPNSSTSSALPVLSKDVGTLPRRQTTPPRASLALKRSCARSSRWSSSRFRLGRTRRWHVDKRRSPVRDERYSWCRIFKSERNSDRVHLALHVMLKLIEEARCGIDGDGPSRFVRAPSG